jgi:transposase
VAKAMDYMLKRIEVFTRVLDDGRICLSNNAAERKLQVLAVRGVHRGGERGAVMLTLIHTAKLNGVDPQAWLADVLARMPITDQLPGRTAAWNWRRAIPVDRAA